MIPSVNPGINQRNANRWVTEFFQTYEDSSGKRKGKQRDAFTFFDKKFKDLFGNGYLQRMDAESRGSVIPQSGFNTKALLRKKQSRTTESNRIKSLLDSVIHEIDKQSGKDESQISASTSAPKESQKQAPKAVSTAAPSSSPSADFVGGKSDELSVYDLIYHTSPDQLTEILQKEEEKCRAQERKRKLSLPTTRGSAEPESAKKTKK